MIIYLLEIAAGFILILLALKGQKSVSFSPGCNESRVKAERMSRRQKAAAVFLFFLFLVLITYKVDEIPVAYNVDEAASAYDALSIAHYGVDRHLYKNTVYFINFGGGQNALYTYLAVIMFKLFGCSILCMRMPAILLSAVSMLCFAVMIRNEYGNRALLIALFLFCVLPFSIMHSRWGLESYLLFPMLIISCTVLNLAVRSWKLPLFIFSGILFGVTLYTYAISYVVVPLFIGTYFIYLLSAKKICLKHLIAFSIPLFIFALPLMLMLAVNNGLIAEIRTPFISIPKLPEYRGGEIGFHHIPENVKPDKANILYRIFFNDMKPYNSAVKFGTMYYVSLPLILLGFILICKKASAALRRKQVSADLMIFLVFFASAVTTLMIQDINVNRACEIYFPLIWFLTAGLERVTRRSRISAAAAAAIYLLSGVFFIHYYFTEFPDIVKNSYGFASITDLEEALAFEESMNRDRNTVYVIGKNQPYISTILALKADPYTFAEGKITEGVNVTGFENFRFMRHLHWDGIPDKPVYIFRDIIDIPWQMDLQEMESKQFGTVKVYYSGRYYEPLPAE